jgi:hypothetical protein
MLADPQSVTINSVATSMARTQQGATTNVYTSADGLTTLTTKQNKSATRFRREYRVSQTKVAADPISAVNKQVGFSVYFVVDEPTFGFTDAEIGYVIAGMKTAFDSTLWGKILAGEF